MQALRIIAELETGQVGTVDGRLPIDGIIAAAWMRRHRPDLFYHTDAGRREDLIVPELPLERRTLNGDWFWAASFAQYEAATEGLTHTHKRFDDTQAAEYVDFGKRRGRVHTQSGYFKAQRLPLVYIVTPQLTWYAFGDLAEVRSLLETIPAVGKKTARGFGDVAQWRVEPWPEDLSCVDARGRLMRALPDPQGSDHGGIRPPYWHPSNWAWCWRPPAGGYRGDASEDIDWFAAVDELEAARRGA